jgi:hypothetical protein
VEPGRHRGADPVCGPIEAAHLGLLLVAGPGANLAEPAGRGGQLLGLAVLPDGEAGGGVLEAPGALDEALRVDVEELGPERGLVVELEASSTGGRTSSRIC